MTLYEESEFCVRTDYGETQFFKILSGMKQGFMLFPFLFVL
jgi:hypothetical protein